MAVTVITLHYTFHKARPPITPQHRILDMFQTIGHTFSLMKMSWGVLMQDRELVAFPVMSAVGLLLLGVAGYTSGIVDQDTMDTVAGWGTMFGFLVLAYLITVFFNAALVSAALERLRGGDPTIGSGLSHAAKHIHHIFLWALISATVQTILQALRARGNNFITDLVTRLIGGAWEFFTFFVVPVMVAEGHGPISGIKRSVSIVRQTWGRQIAATFGFFIVYLVALIGAAIPAILLFMVLPAAGVIVGVLLVGLAIAVVQTLEGIFKAALYDYATGSVPAGFDLRTLANAYAPSPA